MADFDERLQEVFGGKLVRKDLLHRIKKGTNVPTFVLEFLLARYCASDDEEEIKQGIAAVLATLQDNYVRPDEANAAQSKVATQGAHRFIDKIHVNYIEREKRHWAALENFNSKRVAVSQKFYRNNKRLLEGGIWAEITIGFNEIEEDDYTFFVKDLRPIQLSRFDFDGYVKGRKQFNRDEWMNLILRSVGLEPTKLTNRVKLHFITRLASLVEPNFNFIELGPRGTGKSYFFSEFSPYSTLISGGQATKAVLFYNNARKRIGLVGFWDTVAFDEVAGIRIRDADMIQIMKDFMANGRFSRGVDVIADASLAFNGNIDYSIDQLVNSSDHDLFIPLPKEMDLAVMDRFAFYLPGWEMPKTSSEYLTEKYGFITDYLAEAFHYMFAHTNRYEEVNQRIKLGPEVEGRDEKGIKKTVSALLKILHPDGVPGDEEFEEYVAYAVEGRRRVKEQMNKRKPDDEFAKINLSYFDKNDKEVIIFCPESKNAAATQEPERKLLEGLEASDLTADKNPDDLLPVQVTAEKSLASSYVRTAAAEPEEKHFTILYDDVGYSYESIIRPYFENAKEVTVEDPYIRMTHQIQNFVRFCEAVVKHSAIRSIKLITNSDDEHQRKDVVSKFEEIKQSLLEIDIVFVYEFNENLHDREIRLDNGWVIKIGRGLDFYQKPATWNDIGVHDLSLRRCLETKVDIFFDESAKKDQKENLKNENPAIHDLVKSLESKILEFKSSLQWDNFQKKLNKDLRHEVLKTITAFMNSEGGTLLIGVEDDGSVYGLENDLKVSGKSLDRYGQLLSNLISDHLGPGYSKFVDFRFEEMEGKTICVVEVEPASRAVYLDWDQDTEFHVRIGNTTKQLNTQEAHDYIGMHWQ